MSQNLGFDVAGTGSPLVLVHGWCCNRGHMAGLLEELSATHRVFAVDLPGHGESSPLAHYPSFDVYANVLAEFLEEQNLHGAFLIGHSMGGVLSVLAGGKSNCVAGVVNLDGALPLTGPAHDGYRNLFQQINETGFRAAIEPFLRRAFFLPSERGKIMESLIVDMLAAPEDLARELLAQFPTLDASGALRRCSVPLLYIGATHPRYDEAAVAAIRPRTYLARVVRSGHFLQTFALPQIVAMVHQFIGTGNDAVTGQD